MTYQLIHGDARHVSDHVAPGSVDLLITSPPYFSLRSYQDGGEHYDGQIGSEPTPTEFLDALIECTRDWLTVMRPTGSLWVNLGDSYSRGTRTTRDTNHLAGGLPCSVHPSTIPAKSLMGLPWRYAIRCIDELGLILRAEVIWSKPNGLPESVTDRVRRSHEQWFHFSLQPRYYAAVDEIREPHASFAGFVGHKKQYGKGQRQDDGRNMVGKLPGSVWTVPTEPLRVPADLGVDHFAAFPSEWPRRIILGWSPSGYCTACDQPRRPVVAGVGLDMSRPQARRAQELADAAGLTEEHFAALLAVGTSDTGRGAATQSGTGKNRPEVYALADEARSALGGYSREYLLRRPTGFRYACDCPTPDAPTRPAVVLDPFGGTGTVAGVAHALGRHGVHIDLSHDYLRLAKWRIEESNLVARTLERTGIKVPDAPAIDGQLDLFGGAA